MKLKRFIGIIIVLSLVFSVVSGASTNVNLKKNMEVKEKETSFGISKQNISLSSVHDTRPLNEYENNYLTNLGFSKKELSNMDKEDFKKVEISQTLTKIDIENIIMIYPELKDHKLDKWTYEDYQKYQEKEFEKETKLSQKQIDKVMKKGITVDDAKYLRKYYSSIDEMVEEDEMVLKDILIQYYDMKNSYLDMMNKYEEQDLQKNNLFSGLELKAVAGPIHPENYATVAFFAGYTYSYDLFNTDSGTQYSSIRITQEVKAKTIYQRAYSTSSNPIFNNMWGTYSATSNGTHEGIDLARYENAPVYNPVNGNLSVAKEYHNPKISSDYIVVLQGYSKSYFFIHMGDEIVSSGTTVTAFSRIGDEGDRHPTLNLASHLHYAVENGYTTTTHDATNDDELDSANPYTN